MSLYNRLFGENPDATALLGMLSLTRKDFERYRDVYLNKGGTRIIVVARIGGTQKKYYKHVFKTIKKHPNYIKNYDDEFDQTYTYFEFSIPEKYAHTCKSFAPKEERLSVGDMFKKEAEESQIPGTEAYKRAEEIAAEIMKNLESGNHIIEL